MISELRRIISGLEGVLDANITHNAFNKDMIEISSDNQVWAADITYIPMARGFLYLV